MAYVLCTYCLCLRDSSNIYQINIDRAAGIALERATHISLNECLHINVFQPSGVRPTEKRALLVSSALRSYLSLRQKSWSFGMTLRARCMHLSENEVVVYSSFRSGGEARLRLQFRISDETTYVTRSRNIAIPFSRPLPAFSSNQSLPSFSLSYSYCFYSVSLASTT